MVAQYNVVDGGYGLLVMFGMIVASLVVMSIVIFNCGESGEHKQKSHTAHNTASHGATAAAESLLRTPPC
ncbi:hypothetical protein A4A49_23072 [Nicotiana attenuata]|uniref:Uncharacterized protein n=1 Tax=Nicotiana attenuata TaxID=49451 RepID=A0A1J6I5E0_NICAT|nr:hypothetical protein A4A49_23072 [Nicotiana attenuata]